VLAITIGLTTGAASRNAIPTGSGSPLRYNRRVTGTTPHSQTGKAKPIRPPATVASTGWRGRILIRSSWLMNASISPDVTVPSSKNGAASMKMPRNRVLKTVSVSVTSKLCSSWYAIGAIEAIITGPAWGVR